MTKPPKTPKPEKIETDPGAWERFEHAVDAAVASGPKHRVPKPKLMERPPKPKESSDKRDQSRKG